MSEKCIYKEEILPTYVYDCPECGEFEKRQSFSDPVLTRCPVHDLPITRVFQPTPLIMKGKYLGGQRARIETYDTGKFDQAFEDKVIRE